MTDQELGRFGYNDADLRRVAELCGGTLESPTDIENVINSYAYLDDWKANYRIQSVRQSLHAKKITCIDGAILAYGLLELLFNDTKRRLLAIHRKDPKKDEECGHCVALYWGDDGRIGAFSKSSFKGLGHRKPIYTDELAIATTYAKAYVDMGFVPLYFGVTTIEEAAPGLDWRFHDKDLNVVSEALQARYEYGFMLAD